MAAECFQQGLATAPLVPWMAPRGQWRPGDDFCARLGRLFADAGDATNPDTGLPTRAGWGDPINPGEADMASVPYAFVDDANHFRKKAIAFSGVVSWWVPRSAPVGLLRGFPFWAFR
eukprot:COSAG01_NODE_39738_length_472_cov_4.391421_1_plen_116_part_10